MIARDGVGRASFGVAAFMVTLTLGSTAFALSVNFTDGTWTDAQGLSSYTTHTSGIDLIATNGPITVNGDGLGIGDDEIGLSGLEKLKVQFAAPVMLNTVYISDLFPREGALGLAEGGLYSVNGGQFSSFSSGNSTGNLALTINKTGVTSIVFKSKGDLGLSDFSVRGLTYATPEPSSVLLLGTVMLFLAAWIKRFSNQS